MKEAIKYLKKYPEALRLVEVWLNAPNMYRPHNCPLTILEEECEEDPEWSVPIQEIVGDICYEFCAMLFPAIMRSDGNKFGCPCTCGFYNGENEVYTIVTEVALRAKEEMSNDKR